MSVTRTVYGDIDASNLGVLYAHEQLLTGPPTTGTDPELTVGTVWREMAYRWVDQAEDE